MEKTDGLNESELISKKVLQKELTGHEYQEFEE